AGHDASEIGVLIGAAARLLFLACLGLRPLGGLATTAFGHGSLAFALRLREAPFLAHRASLLLEGRRRLRRAHDTTSPEHGRSGSCPWSTDLALPTIVRGRRRSVVLPRCARAAPGVSRTPPARAGEPHEHAGQPAHDDARGVHGERD